jgi:arginase family enzyme
MSDALLIKDFLQPVSLSYILGDITLNESQWGTHIHFYEEELPDLDKVDIVLLGIPDERGTGSSIILGEAPDCIRKQFYQLYQWHPDLRLADIGNIKAGKTLSDTYAAARTVIKALIDEKISVIILGGSHDLTLAQYGAYVEKKKIIEVSCVDAHINLVSDSAIKSETFLMEMLTGEPNYIKHYNHLAFQSYFVHPTMLQTMDKLRFDCYRLGSIKESIQEMEPVLRNSHMLSIDMSALAYAYAPGSAVSPNGLNGEEMCTLTRFAGMSQILNSIGIYGYNSDEDVQQLTAMQIAQMIWYFIDGKVKGKTEAKLSSRDEFNEFHTAFNEIDTLFLQSKKTGRWWMQMPDGKIIPCSQNDYKLASHNEIPERWFRVQERG